MKSRGDKIVIIRVDRCLGCKSCEVACAVAHSTSKNLQRIVESGEKPGYRIHVEDGGGRAIPIHCNNCEEAACVLACPTGALHRTKDKIPVLMNADRCVGCRMCVQACPFGVITVNRHGKGVLKCDLCLERLEQGLEPACVAACPTRALKYACEEEAVKAKRRKTAVKLAAAVD